MSIIKGIVDSFSNFLFSISYAGLGIVLFVVTMKITQNLYRLVLKYLTWYIQTVKGRIKTMKKAMITGIVIFVGFFLAATLVWFVHDKDEYKKLKYDRAYSNVKMNNLNIDRIIQNSQLSKENIVVLNIMVIMMLRYIAQKIHYI